MHLSLQIQWLLVQNTRKIAKDAPTRDETMFAAKFFERWQDLYFFPEELHYGKD